MTECLLVRFTCRRAVSGVKPVMGCKGILRACYNLLALCQPHVSLMRLRLCKEIYCFYGPDNRALCGASGWFSVSYMVGST